MSSLADRNRKLMIQRVEGDPRLEGAAVIAATTLMRFSISVLVMLGVLGAIAGQVLLGEGGIQFAVGMVAGYASYLAYLALTMKEPRTVGAMAALTNSKLFLLGSRRAGVIGEWKFKDLEAVELVRKGNFLVMGKLSIRPKRGEPLTFFTPNRRLAVSFVDSYQEASAGKSRPR